MRATNGFMSHKPPNGRQIPQPEKGSNFSFGPGDQASWSIVSEDNVPQPAAAPPNQAPQQGQSAASLGGSSIVPGSSPGQPPRTSLASQLAPSNAPATAIPVLTVTPMASSTLVPSSTVALGVTVVQPSSISTSVMLSTSTSISVSTVLSTSTSAPEDAIEDTSSSPPPLATSAAAIAMSASGTSEPSQTPSPSVSPTSSSSGHNPPFYVGIVLGTIVVVAILAALIAWGVRLRTHARRRSENNMDVPWAKRGNNDAVLEEGRHLAFSGSRNLTVNTSAMDISSQDAMAHAHTWEPRGDRDVGEPKRTGSFLNAPISPYRQPTPTYDPFSDYSHYPHLADSAVYPLPAYNSPYTATHGVPSYLTGIDFDAGGSVDDHGSTSTLGPLHVANLTPGDASTSPSRAPTAFGMNAASGGYGTPREDMTGSRPRFLGLEGKGLQVPWTNAPAPRPNLRSFGSRRSWLRNSGNWEHLSPLPMPGESVQEREAAERDGWAMSLKSNLMNAFNAVAANIPSGPTIQNAQEDYLTPTPSRQAADRSAQRQSKEWSNFTGNPLTREGTITSSSAWTLEDNGNGSGTVHFRGLEGYGGGDHAFSPQVGGSSLTLHDGDRSDIGTDIYRPSTQDSQTPLIVTKKPKTAFLRPDIYSRLSNYGSTKPAADTGSISRASSVYSTASGTPSAYPGSETPVPQPPRLPVFSRQSTMTIETLGPASKKDGTNNDRPVNASRLSSSGCSFSSYRTDGTTTAIDDCSETEEAVHNAITDRRRRLRRVI